MASIGFVLEQIKRDPARLLDHLPVREVCLQLQLTWRERSLDPATTVALFVRSRIELRRLYLFLASLKRDTAAAAATPAK